MAVSELLSSRIRAVLVTGIAGAIVSHTWMPWAPGATRLQRTGFALLMFAMGTGFGALDARIRAVRGGGILLQSSLFGALALAVSLAAWALLHG